MPSERIFTPKPAQPVQSAQSAQPSPQGVDAPIQAAREEAAPGVRAGVPPQGSGHSGAPQTGAPRHSVQPSGAAPRPDMRQPGPSLRPGSVPPTTGASPAPSAAQAVSLRAPGSANPSQSPGGPASGATQPSAPAVKTAQLPSQLQATAKPAPPKPAPSRSFSLAGMESVLLGMGVKPSHVEIAVRRARQTNESLDRIMRDFGFLTGEQVAEALSKLHGFPHFNASDMDGIERQHLADIRLAEYRRFVPVGRDDDGALLVAVPDTGLIGEAGNAFYNEKTRMVLASEQTILTVYRRYFANTERTFDEKVASFTVSQNARRRDEDDSTVTLVKDIYMSLLRHACYSGASDVYLFRSGFVGVIKLKINGVGQLFRTIDVALYDRLLNKLALENAKAEELRKEPKETTITFGAEDAQRHPDIVNRYGFRLELTESRGIKGAVFRILDRNSEATDLARLGLDDEILRSLNKISRTSNGLFLITGPTGSGKTTSLYAMLKAIDPIERSIQTIENPIEYEHGLWQQYEVRRDAENEGEEYHKWLKALLRNAPDVILVGEVRDAEVGNICMHAANTGHLVFATLHTNSASLALARLKALGLDLNMLSSLLLGVLGQRLVRLLCKDCREPDNSRETAAALEDQYLGQYLPKPFRAGKGCENCDHTGYRGRRAIYELLLTSKEVRQAIEADESPLSIAAKGLEPGETIWGNGIKLVAQGVTSYEELQRVATKEL